MTDRLKTLRRIEAVQGEMIKLTEWRLAAAERACRDIAADARRLRGFIGGHDEESIDGDFDRGPLGSTLTRAAQKALGSLNQRLAAAEQDRAEQRAKLDTLRRRDHAVHAATRRAATSARRDEEARELAAVVEAWLAVKPS